MKVKFLFFRILFLCIFSLSMNLQIFAASIDECKDTNSEYVKYNNFEPYHKRMEAYNLETLYDKTILNIKNLEKVASVIYPVKNCSTIEVSIYSPESTIVTFENDKYYRGYSGDSPDRYYKPKYNTDTKEVTIFADNTVYRMGFPTFGGDGRMQFFEEAGLPQGDSNYGLSVYTSYDGVNFKLVSDTLEKIVRHTKDYVLFEEVHSAKIPLSAKYVKVELRDFYKVPLYKLDEDGNQFTSGNMTNDSMGSLMLGSVWFDGEVVLHKDEDSSVPKEEEIPENKPSNNQSGSSVNNSSGSNNTSNNTTSGNTAGGTTTANNNTTSASTTKTTTTPNNTPNTTNDTTTTNTDSNNNYYTTYNYTYVYNTDDTSAKQPAENLTTEQEPQKEGLRTKELFSAENAENTEMDVPTNQFDVDRKEKITRVYIFLVGLMVAYLVYKKLEQSHSE